MSQYAEDLKRQFGAVDVPLTTIAEYYLGLDPETAKRRAAKNEIPFPIFKVAKSQKAPWLVNVYDLAKFLINQRYN